MDPRLVPPGTLPPPNGATRAQVQQRPNISYFLFLSLMFYLLNYNNSASIPLTLPSSPSNSTVSPYALARYRLLLREARYEGLSRWLGATNQSSINEDGWLNSTYFPDATSNASTAIKVTPFVPQDPQEPAVVAGEVLERMMRRHADDEQRWVYPQNLTGFVKGGWHARNYSFQQLGLNETWQTVTTKRKATNSTSGAIANSTVSDANSTASLLMARRALDGTSAPPDNATLPLNVTSPLDTSRDLDTVTTSFNRTELRGSFPFTYPANVFPNKALFNFREVQTSAVGPVVPPAEHDGPQDDSRLLRWRAPGDWKDWEKKGPITYLGGEMSISIEEGDYEGQQTSLDIEAAHLLSSGLLYGYATPNFVRSHLVETVSLPFFANASDSTVAQRRDANLTAQAIGRSMLKETNWRLKNDFDHLNETLAEQERNDAVGDPGRGGGEESSDATIPQCIFRFYGALVPLPAEYTPSLYAEFYASLFRPTGASLPPPPTQTLRFVLSSTNCGLVLEGSGTFLPTPLLWTRTKDFALLIGGAQLILVVLLVRHLEKTATRPGTILNVASLSIGVGCVVDAYVFVLLLTAGVVTSATRSSLPLFVPSFLALLSSLLFGMRYVSMIRAATPPPSTQPAQPAATPQATVPTPSREDSAATAAERTARGEDAGIADEQHEDILAPLVARAPTSPSTRESSTGSGSIPTREKVNLALMVLALCASVAIIFRWGWIPWLMTIVYSYWMPQIVLNVHRGTARQSLTTEFIVGTTFARLVLPVYFYGYSDNVLDVEVSPWIFILILYSSLQAFVLVLQSRPSFGARFFLSQRALDLIDLPQVYSWDYHQPLSSSKLLDIEASLREEGNADEAGPTCSICMDTVTIRPSKSDVDLLGSVLAGERSRAAYALTPCGHLLHTQCLQEWMNVRAICPECRKSLPSLS